MGGLNPAKMKAMMKQMGIDQKEIDAERVIIKKRDGVDIIIENPSIQEISMQGNVSWQIAGDAREETRKEGFSDEDIQMVMEKTGKEKDEVVEALKETGDIAEAIIKLSE